MFNVKKEILRESKKKITALLLSFSSPKPRTKSAFSLPGMTSVWNPLPFQDLWQIFALYFSDCFKTCRIYVYQFSSAAVTSYHIVAQNTTNVLCISTHSSHELLAMLNSFCKFRESITFLAFSSFWRLFTLLGTSHFFFSL